jgi:tetratricopeptide (TPR) repeat protein
LEWDIDRTAFGPALTDAVPQTRPAREAAPLFWWEALWRARAHRSFDQDQATGLLDLFEMLGPSHGRKITALLLANQVGTGCTIGTFLLPAPWQSRVLLDSLDEGPPGALFLAIQAARRVLHDNPDNPEIHFVLGEAYYLLTRKTHERVWIKTFPHLGRIRTVQAIAGYSQAIRLNPNHMQAHLRLGEMYLDMHYKDTALEHFRAALDIMTRHARSGENPDLFRRRKERLDVHVKSLSQEVAKLLEKYEINSENLRLADRAKMAGHFGLSSLALKSLLATDISAFGIDGMELELKMLINVGQGARVREWMELEHEKKLGEAKANWIHVQLGAASGDYRVADQHIPDITESLGTIKSMNLRTAIALQMGQVVLETKPDPSLFSFLWFQARRLNDEANNRVLRGLLALESGNRSQAREHFRRAADFWASPAGIPFQQASAEARTGTAIARHYLSILGNAR